MIRNVLKRGDQLLLQPSTEVTNFKEINGLVTDLWDTLTSIQALYNFTRGSGLAAVQIGRLLKVDVVEFDGQRHTLVNPYLASHSTHKVDAREGCLSFFDYRGFVPRYTEVTIKGVNEAGEPITIEAKDNFAFILQHELDHLNGRLYDSHLAKGQKLFKPGDMPLIP